MNCGIGKFGGLSVRMEIARWRRSRWLEHYVVVDGRALLQVSSPGLYYSRGSSENPRADRRLEQKLMPCRPDPGGLCGALLDGKCPSAPAH